MLSCFRIHPSTSAGSLSISLCWHSPFRSWLSVWCSLKSWSTCLPQWHLFPRGTNKCALKVWLGWLWPSVGFFICWAPYYILQLVHLGIQKPSASFYYVYHVAISMGYANSCINPFLYIILSKSKTFKRQFIVAIQPAHNHFRVNPSSTEATVSLRLTATAKDIFLLTPQSNILMFFVLFFINTT